MTSLLCHFLCLALVTSLLPRTRGENATEHITIKKQGDGPLVMSSDIGESQGNFTDWQLDMDLIEILEGSERRLEFSGVLKDGVTNRTAECSSSKIDVMEERKKLLRIFCPNEGDEDFKVISRSVWAEVTGENGSHTSDDEDLFRIYRRMWEGMEYPTLRRTKQAELLIVSVHFSIVSNFFIEDDGRIFEGFGWDNVSYGISGGLEDRALLISFVDKGASILTPSEAAIRAYESLVRYAICTGRLPTDYKLIPYHLIWDIASYKEWRDPEYTNYERNQMRDWNAYTDNVDFLFPPVSEVDLPVVSREEWMGVRPNSTKDVENTTIALEHPVSRMVVSNYGPRCFRDCGKLLKWIADTEELGAPEWNLPYNFIITESGRVYEGFGWNHTFSRGLKQKYFDILFLGCFYSYSPRRPALFALKKIIDEGLRNGKIIPEYQMITRRGMRSLYQDISKRMD